MSAPLVRVAILSRCESNGATVYSNVKNLLSADLLGRLEVYEVRYQDVPASLDFLKKAEIVVADPGLIAPYVDNLPALRWIQCTYAGTLKLSFVGKKEENFFFFFFYFFNQVSTLWSILASRGEIS